MQGGWLQQRFTRLERQAADPDSAPRVLFVYAHPDDEMIAVGGRLPWFRDALFVQVTDGAPADNADGDRLGLSRDDYRVARTLEQRAAFAAAGLPEARHRALNLPDKEAAFHLEELTASVRELVRAERPEIVFTHPYEGGHADHDACAFAVHTAVAALERDLPRIVESPFYFAGAGGMMCAGAFLQESAADTVAFPLLPEEISRKRAAFDAFATQSSVLQAFDRALREERFRLAPNYNFRQPAVAGAAYYESFIPHMTAVRFAELAAQALHRMQPETVAV